MAVVPANYTPEPGETRCGASFGRGITVTGEIYGSGGIGAELKHIVPRLSVMPTGNWWSYRSQDEANLIDSVKTRIPVVADDAQEQFGHDAISLSQKNAIDYLLDLAHSNLRRVDEIYAYWDGKIPHPATGVGLPYDSQYNRVSEWPLGAGDAIYQHTSECKGVSGDWVADRELQGSTVRQVRWYFCPDETMRQQRSKDRNAIRSLVLNAARAVRCAEWGLWRIVLYRQALALWEEKYGDRGSFAAGTPGPGPGLVSPASSYGLYEEPIGRPPSGGVPPDEPEDFPLPDIDSLPPPGEEPPDDEGMGGEIPPPPEPIPVGGGMGASPPPGPSKSTFGPAALPLAVGLGALGLYFATR